MTKEEFRYYARCLGERNLDSIAGQWADLAEHDIELARFVMKEVAAIKATVDYVRRKMEK